jgi:hypothetical protein
MRGFRSALEATASLHHLPCCLLQQRGSSLWHDDFGASKEGPQALSLRPLNMMTPGLQNILQNTRLPSRISNINHQLAQRLAESSRPHHPGKSILGVGSGGRCWAAAPRPARRASREASLTVSGSNVRSRQSREKPARIGAKSQTGMSNGEEFGKDSRVFALRSCQTQTNAKMSHGRETPFCGSRSSLGKRPARPACP